MSRDSRLYNQTFCANHIFYVGEQGKGLKEHNHIYFSLIVERNQREENRKQVETKGEEKSSQTRACSFLVNIQQFTFNDN